jgi:hypothetical protein
LFLDPTIRRSWWRWISKFNNRFQCNLEEEVVVENLCRYWWIAGGGGGGGGVLIFNRFSRNS